MFDRDFDIHTEDGWVNIVETNRSKIGFCIWVLTLDGLQVPPFNQHGEGNHLLRDAGLNAQEWREWLTKVVLTQDARLGSTDSLEQKQEELGQFRDYLNNQNPRQFSWIEWSKILPSDDKFIYWQIQQYRLAVELAHPYCRNCSPPGVWTGEPRIRDLLAQLWHDYQSLPVKQFERYDCFPDPNREASETMLWDNLLRLGRRIFAAAEYYRFFNTLKRYKGHLPILNTYIIDYPVPVTYLVPPVSVILSVSDQELDSPGYWKRLLNAVEGLTETSSN